MDESKRLFIVNELSDRFGFEDKLVGETFLTHEQNNREEYLFAIGIGTVLYHMINPELIRSAKEVTLCLKKSKIPKKCDVERAAGHLVLKGAVGRAAGLIIAESQAESIEDYINNLSEVYKRPKIQEYMKKYVPISFSIAEKLKYDITIKEFQRFVRLPFDAAMEFLKNSMYVRVHNDK